MNKNSQNILLSFLILFSFYCAVTIGQSWDEGQELLKGKITFDYLLSLGSIDTQKYHREYFVPIYGSLLYLLSKVSPNQYQIETLHIINLLFSLSVVFGLGKLCKEIFNKKIGKISFLILFFYPIFFGHMAMNNKDLILALSHVWITYLVFRYFKKQKIKEKRNKYIIIIGLLTAIGTGIQLVFLGSLLPLFLFILLEVFYFNKIINKSFEKKILFLDFIKTFIIFYLILVIFWIDAHPNVFVLPFQFFLETLSNNYITGWPVNLVDGKYYFSNKVPKFYFLINFIYKSPEYFLISYLFFIIFILKFTNFFTREFRFFKYKILFIFSIILFPNVIMYIIPYPVYDGMRLFLWCIPYLCIVPAITVYYLIENLRLLSSKIYLGVMSVFTLLFLINFITITPYQYTYLNSISGPAKERYKKFENDYWSTSIKELLKNINFEDKETILISTCGVSLPRVKYYLKKERRFNFKFVNYEESDYLIMTNRAIIDLKTNKLTNCFDKYKGKDFSNVKRNGVKLSIIQKI